MQGAQPCRSSRIGGWLFFFFSSGVTLIKRREWQSNAHALLPNPIGHRMTVALQPVL